MESPGFSTQEHSLVALKLVGNLHQCHKSDPSSSARPQSQPVGPSRESGGILPGPCAAIHKA